MRIRRPGLLGLGASVVVIGVMAVATYAALTAAGVDFDFSGSAGQSTETQQPQTSGASAQNQLLRPRNQYTVCIDAVDVDPSVRMLAKEQVEAALPTLAQHPAWNALAWYHQPPVVDIGCPTQPMPLTSGIPFFNGIPEPGATLQGVLERNYYRTFVYILPSVEEIDALLGGSEIRVASQEYEEGDHGLTEVTLAVYVTVDELGEGTDFLVPLLVQGAGFENR
jgi:hypothetical protein